MNIFSLRILIGLVMFTLFIVFPGIIFIQGYPYSRIYYKEYRITQIAGYITRNTGLPKYSRRYYQDYRITQIAGYITRKTGLPKYSRRYYQEYRITHI